MVGGTNSERDRMYGEILAKYFIRPNTIFIISSDFCHWGKNRIYYLNYSYLYPLISFNLNF